MRKIALLLATLALVAAGCGGDDEESGSGGTSTAAEPAATTPADDGGSASGEVAISMKNIQFDPADATAKVGQKVVWTNDDDAPHNVIGGPIKSETFGKGETFEYTPTEAGTIDYVCTIHPGMDGKLTVTE
jgi:plastocyanin